MKLLEKFNFNKKLKPEPIVVNTQPEEKKIPEFVKLIEAYQLDLSKVDTPEKAKENFAKCAELFLKLCPKSGNENYTTEELLNLDIGSIEGQYHNTQFEYGIRARLSIPSVDKKIIENNPDLTLHVPGITTGDHQECTQDVFHFFVSKFIEEGLVVKFNL